jgi:hypothetical protein
MTRKLILTPFEHGCFWMMHKVINQPSMLEHGNKLDIPHLLLGAVTMAGVDKIYSIGTLGDTNTTLIKKIVTKSSEEDLYNCNQQVDSILNAYPPLVKSKEQEFELTSIKYFISHILFAMKTNSVVLYLGDFNDLRNQSILPLEFTTPFNILLSSIQTRSANLPVIQYDINKEDIKKLLDVIDSREYNFYKEAQSEIESGTNLNTRTINLIEKAGKDLYQRNRKLLNLRETIVKAVPLSSKVIDLFFGKLPGILLEYAGNVLINYIKTNKTLPIYNYDSFITGLIKYRNIYTEKQLYSMINKGSS